MQQQENKLFKIIVQSMHKYYFGETIDDVNEMITHIKGYKITDGDSSADYNNILDICLENIQQEGIQITTEFAKDLMVDFRLDIGPTYIETETK